VSGSWGRRRLGIGLLAVLLAVTLSPVLAALVGAPVAKGDPTDPIPTVQVGLQASAFIGETVGFDVSFWNASPSQPGYGPYVDIKLPVGDDAGDGMSFISATYLTQGVTATQLHPDGFGNAPHPYALDPDGHAVIIHDIAPGQEYWVLRLPFGSFTPGQPKAVVHVTARISTGADVGVPLEVDVNGGFQFGRTPLNDPTQGDPSTIGPVVPATITPTIMRVTKSYIGPESETATGPDYQRSYRIDVTIAPGQTVDDVTITDVLPDTIQYVSTNAPSSPFSSITEPFTTKPGGQLVIDFGPVGGPGPTTSTATATFNFYVPSLNLAGDPVLDPTTGAFNTSMDSVTAAGKWNPADTADGTDIHVTAGPATHTLADKSIAIQKGVRKIGPGEVGPGDILEWTIDVQVSDYFAFNNIIVDDLMGNDRRGDGSVIGDGSVFDPSFTPTMSVSGNVDLPAQAMAGGDYVVSGVDGDGKTPYRFRVSTELNARGVSSESLIGNCVGLGGSDPPDCAHSDGPTMVQIIFHTIVQRTYVGGQEVVEGDTLDNVASVYGDLLDTGTLAPNGHSIGDGGPGAKPAGTTASIAIHRGVLTKTIYAINNSTTIPNPVHVSPGDRVTYRLKQDFPASRTDDFSVTDFLPLPVFYATEMTHPFDAVADPGTIPETGYANYGPDDNFHTRCSSDTPAESCPDAPKPVVGFDSTANSVTFTYGNYALYPAQLSYADILFTVTVSTDPFADGLLLTNQARSQTSNSVGTVVNADAIVQITLDQPVLAITKGVVGTDNPAGVFAPVTTGVVAFKPTVAPNDPAACPAFTGAPITNARLTDNPLTDPLNQDLLGVDAGDYVRYAVVVQNTGHASAFNVKVKDAIPADMREPVGGFDMCITNGAGTAIAATNITGGGDIGQGDQLFHDGIQFTDPSVDGQTVGSLAAGASGAGADNTAGTNIAVITYTLQVATSAVPTSVIQNTATLMGFSNDPASANHLAAWLTDDATVTLAQPVIDKTLESTGQSNGTSVAIGERVTYKVTLTIPEGTLPNARVVDQLPPGLGFTACQSIEPSADVTTDHAGGFADVCANPTVVGSDGPQVTFNLGQIVNSNAANGDADTITITYDAVVLNTTGTNRGTSLQNAATFLWDGGTVVSVGPASAPAVVVHEPQLSIRKDASKGSGDAFDTINYTITISDPGAVADPNGGAAFDIEETDKIPTGMTYDGSVPFAQDPGGPAVSSLTVVAGVLDVKWDKIAQGETAVLHYSVKIDSNVAPGTSLPNTANLTWTSLPGPVPGERTGSDGPGGALNDYATSDGAEVDVPAVAAAKSVVATDQATTTGNNVTVGEIVTYRVVLTIPEGVALNSRLVDSLPAGMAFVACHGGTPIVATSGVSTDLAGGWADACDTGKDLTVANSGRDLTFALGTVTNSNVNAGSPATITITYDAVVLNVPGNVRGTTLHNGAEMFWQNAEPVTFHSNTAAAADLTVVEPLMTVGKSADKTTGDAGDVFTFTVTIANPTDTINHHGTDAFGVDWSDLLPAGLDYSAVNFGVRTTTCATPPDSGPSAAGQGMSAHWDNFPEGGSCTIQYQAVLADTVPANSTYTNDAKLTWTSLPGDHNTLPGLSTYSDVSTERTGTTSDPGGTANTYARSSTVTVDVVQPAPVKSVVTTSEAGTTGTTNVEIGEIVRYRVYVTIPEGVTDGVSIRDTLSPGLTYLNDNTTKIALVTNDAGMTSTSVPNGDPGSDLYKSGADTWPTLGNHPTYVMPGGAISGGSGGAGALNGFQPGDDPIFDLGTVTNSDRDDDAELVVIEFNVLVDNVLGNQSGTSLTDRAAIWADPPLPAAQTPAKLKDSNGPLTQTVVEPAMALTKSITTHPVDAGDGIVYRISVTNSSATAPAYDYQILDTIPAALVSPPSSIVTTCVPGPNPNASSGALINITLAEVAPGATCTVDVTTTVVTTEPAGETFTNTANATYSSLPGLTGTDEAGGNATGSTHAADSGTPTGERTGAGGINDYTNTNHVDQTLAAPSIVKNAPSLANAPVGAESTFDLVVTLPEGTTRGLVVTDTLPDGLVFLSATPVTSGGLLASPFSGTFTDSNPTPVVTVPDGTHHAYALTFGDTVVPVDGLTGNEQFEIRVTVRVANVAGNQAGTDLWNSAKLTYTNGATPVDVAAPAQQKVTVFEPDVRMTKTVSSTTPYFGDTVTYTLTLSHGNGASDITAYDVKLVDTLPVAAGWTYAGALNAGACPDADVSTPSYSAGVITTTFTSFPLNHTCTITYQATIGVKPNSQLGSAYTNTAVATWTSLAGPSDYERTGSNLDPGGALNDYNVTRTVTATVTGVDLAITKTDGVTTAIAAQVNLYTVSYQNNGNVTATGVVVTETVPVGSTFNSGQSTAATWLAVGGGACPNNAAAGTVCHANIGSVAPMPGNAGSKVFAVTVVDPIPSGLTQIVNTATIADDGTHHADATPADNTATDTDTIPQADLSLTKTVDVPRPGANKPVVYTITLTNSGPDDATGVQVKDLVPTPAITYISYQAPQGVYNSGTGIWTVTGTVAAGTSKVLTINAVAATSATATNTAEVTHSNDGDPDSTPNNHLGSEDDQYSATTTPLISDVAVTKTVSNSTPDEGTDVTFTITAMNNSGDTASNVRVVDALPAGLTFVSANPSLGSWAGTTWTVGTLANGASATLSLVAHVALAGTRTNTATITSDSFDSNGGNNSASATVSQSLDLAVTKIVNNPTPNVGNQVTFTVGVTNSGPNAAHNVMLHDALPAGLTFVSATPSQGSYSSLTGNWTVGTIASLGSPSMTMVATVTGNGAMTNTASVLSLDETQTSTGNDSANATVTPRRADLAVSKIVDNGGPEIGDTVTFTVTVDDNIGPDGATNVAIHDSLPAGLTLLSATPSQGNYVSSTGTWTVGTLAKNGSATLTVTATVAIGGIYTNTASVSASDQYDPVSGNNSATVSLTSRTADVGVAKVVDNATPSVGATVNYTLTVTNNGPDPATQIVVGDLLPAGLSLVSATPSQGSYTAGNGRWSVGSLALNAHATMTIAARVTASGTIDNTVSLTSLLQTDSNAANNTATATIQVTTAADLAVTKTPSTTRPDVGSNVTYTITATNNGPDDATGVTVSDPLPDGLTFVGATPPAGTSYDSGTWTIGSLANGASVSLPLVATVDVAGLITNTATISGTKFDPVSGNNTATASVDQRVDLVVTKSVLPLKPNVGTNATFTIHVSNAGQNTANHIVIRDLLPAGLTYVSDSGAGAYVQSSGDWTIASLEPEESTTLDIVARVDSQAPVTNTAAVHAVDETDSDHTNDTGTATVTPPWADLHVTKSVESTTPEMGDSVTFTVTVDNLGPDGATNVMVHDALPTDITWVSDDGGGDYNHSTGDWTVDSIAFPGSATLHVTATVDARGDYTNTASVSHSDQYDPVSGNNSGSAFLTTKTVEVGVTKTVDHATPAVGSVVSYTVTATNAGENPATGLVIHDALPSGRLTFVSASADTGSYDAITGDWTIGTLTVGPVATLTLVARVIDSGKIDNTAAVSAMLQRDTKLGNNSATVQIDAPPAADLSLTKTVDNDTPDKGSSVVFTVTVTNSGPDDTTGVVVTDALPAGLTYVSDDGGTVGPDPAYDSATGHWTVGGLNVGAHATLHITATVDVGETKIVNTAEVTHSDLPDPDSTPGNGVEGEDDQAVAMLNARGVADLAIKKTASPAKVTKGGQTTYTLVVTNKGPQDATGVIVRDQLPSSVTFVSSSGGTYDSKTGAWTVGSLANGDTATLKIVVKVGKTGSIINVTDIVASDQRDPNASNDEATAGISAAGPTPAITATHDQGPLPRDPGALALWLLAIAFAGIAVLGLAALASRNHRPRMRR
jgi:uncharacterized repeat protein (TIGR01451 family)/fimbrial isopeptide formation D2 family protein